MKHSFKRSKLIVISRDLYKLNYLAPTCELKNLFAESFFEDKISSICNRSLSTTQATNIHVYHSVNVRIVLDGLVLDLYHNKDIHDVVFLKYETYFLRISKKYHAMENKVASIV